MVMNPKMVEVVGILKKEVVEVEEEILKKEEEEVEEEIPKKEVGVVEEGTPKKEEEANRLSLEVVEVIHPYLLPFLRRGHFVLVVFLHF